MKPLIRVTQLESFRRYISGDYDYMTEQNVIDSITGSFKGNAQTRIGTAFHTIVEKGLFVQDKIPAGKRIFTYYGKQVSEDVPAGYVFIIDGNEIILDAKQCDTAIKYRAEHITAYHEVRKFVDMGDVILTGCADMIDGVEIRDIKTKYSYPDDKDYINSAQWRMYMQMFGADTFHFDLFQFEDYNLDKHGYDVRGLKLTQHLPITVYRYPQMENDNANLIKEFMQWATAKNLVECLVNQNNKIK